jgi:hypothetical protein
MNKLDLLFNPKLFADAFGAAMRDSKPRAMESDPAASVWLEGGTASACAEWEWGHGQIDYRGSRHSFSISGLSIAPVPAAIITATGIVRHLRTLSDFVGHYFKAAAVGRSTAPSSAAYLKNDRGVLIQLVAADAGQRFNVSAEGVSIRLRSQSNR